MRKDLSTVLCFKCGQHGHYANTCTNAAVVSTIAPKRMAEIVLTSLVTVCSLATAED